jgi:hypothetical protein
MAKEKALTMLHPCIVLPAFQGYLGYRYKVHGDHVVFDYEGAKDRVKDAVLLSNVESQERKEEIYGETDGETIWILRGLTFEECVQTLLHEAMHDSVFIVRNTRSGMYKSLSCEEEHDVIYSVLPPEENIWEIWKR